MPDGHSFSGPASFRLQVVVARLCFSHVPGIPTLLGKDFAGFGLAGARPEEELGKDFAGFGLAGARPEEEREERSPGDAAGKGQDALRGIRMPVDEGRSAECGARPAWPRSSPSQSSFLSPSLGGPECSCAHHSVAVESVFFKIAQPRTEDRQKHQVGPHVF